jgi:hypothetical protein
MGEARLDQLRVEMPPPSDEVYARERRDFLDDLDAFMAAECEGKHGADPIGFEVGFGLSPDTRSAEPLESEDPLVIDLGNKRRLILHGRIDRINRLAPGQYEVVDYKTGGYWRDAWMGAFAGGTRLQHAIYGRAAEGLLKPTDKKARVTRGTYVFPAVKGHGRRKTIPTAPKGTLEAVLTNLADIVLQGAFLAAADADACTWCEFKAACHAVKTPDGESKEKMLSAQKLANEANTVLDANRKLKAHE